MSFFEKVRTLVRLGSPKVARLFRAAVRWFRKHRGELEGILSVGSSVGIGGTRRIRGKLIKVCNYRGFAEVLLPSDEIVEVSFSDLYREYIKNRGGVEHGKDKLSKGE